VANATAHALPFADGAFDAVLLSEVLEHVDDDAGALREAVRLLRPGGLALLSVPHLDFPFAWDPLNKVLARFGTRIRRGPFAGIWANHARLYTPEALRRLAESAGLDVEQERSFVRRSLPFVHLLLYGIGKPLLEAPGIGRRLEARAGRGGIGAEESQGSGEVADRGPWAWLRKLATWGDAANLDDEPPGTPTVNLALLGRKP
jgi:SAM-dependent methyltransferase